MKINEKTKGVKVYEVAGEEFTSKEEAEEHLENLEKELQFTYYVVLHSPDTTEGRGYYGKSKFAVVNSYHVYQSLMQYLSKRFGSPLEFGQGVEPIPNYSVVSTNNFDNVEDLHSFKNEVLYSGLQMKKEVAEITYINRSGEEIK